MAKSEYDVVIICDLRFPGGTSFAIAEKVKAQTAAGYTTALIHVPSQLLKLERPFNRAIVQLVQSGTADLLPEGASVKTRLLQIWHPSVLRVLPDNPPRVDAQVKIIVANSPPFLQDRSRVEYNAYEVRENARKLFGPGCKWAPIGPLVREALSQCGWALDVLDEDWYEIINVDEWLVDRSRFVSDRPVIGRHSRPGAEKWPARAEDILAAYPDDDRFIVKILGGAQAPEAVLGRRPKHWQVYELGSVFPSKFLREIDFFVYFHHPAWVEAFGRTILEALASGAVSILPHHFRPLFKEACVYARPGEVREIVLKLYADKMAYLAQSERGVDFVRRAFGYESHIRQLERFIGAPSGGEAPLVARRQTRRRRVLLITEGAAQSNDQSQALALVRRLSADVQPICLTLSDSLRSFREQGFPAEFFAASGYPAWTAGKPPRAWDEVFAERLRQALDIYDPAAVVVDMAVVPEGLRRIMEEDVQRPYIWRRRNTADAPPARELAKTTESFDAVIGPDEAAETAAPAIVATIGRETARLRMRRVAEQAAGASAEVRDSQSLGADLREASEEAVTFQHKTRGGLSWRLRRLGRAFREIWIGPRGLAQREKEMPPLVLVTAYGLTDAQLARAADEIGRLQFITGKFTPIVATDNDFGAPLWRRGILFEYLLPESEWAKYNLGGNWAEFRERQLAAVVETYQPSRVVALDDRETLGSLSAGFLNRFLQTPEAAASPQGN